VDILHLKTAASYRRKQRDQLDVTMGGGTNCARLLGSVGRRLLNGAHQRLGAALDHLQKRHREALGHFVLP
jgi:hypothetical protein